jgi:hypothetical protein
MDGRAARLRQLWQHLDHQRQPPTPTPACARAPAGSASATTLAPRGAGGRRHVVMPFDPRATPLGAIAAHVDAHGYAVLSHALSASEVGAVNAWVDASLRRTPGTWGKEGKGSTGPGRVVLMPPCLFVWKTTNEIYRDARENDLAAHGWL